MAFKSRNLRLPVKHMVRANGRLFYVRNLTGRPVALWQHDDMTYSLVGDVHTADLLHVASLIDCR
jgi:hypothetical protein